MKIILPYLLIGSYAMLFWLWEWLNGRLQEGASAPILFEHAREVGLLLVAHTGGGFLDRGTAAQEFYGLILSLLS
jgi:hypothetical protein